MWDAPAFDYRLGRCSALGTLLGVILSGPLAVALVQATHPQPLWTGPEAFANAFHPVQSLPYLGGIVLVAALVSLLVSAHAVGGANQRIRSTLALILTAVFASLVFLNYTIQTTYVPVLARQYAASNGPLLGALAMANPKSLAWGLEMWGWGFAGVATWLLAPVFDGGRLERATRAAFTLNGPVSVAGTVWTVIEPGWVMTPAGLVAFCLWNVLLAALALLAWGVFRKHQAAAVRRDAAARF